MVVCALEGRNEWYASIALSTGACAAVLVWPALSLEARRALVDGALLSPILFLMLTMNADRIASGYRWLEYAAFGLALEQARFDFLSRAAGARRVLILGEGDGRFLARLLDESAACVASSNPAPE